MRVTIVVTAPIATFEQKKAKESESTVPRQGLCKSLGVIDNDLFEERLAGVHESLVVRAVRLVEIVILHRLERERQRIVKAVIRDRALVRWCWTTTKAAFQIGNLGESREFRRKLGALIIGEVLFEPKENGVKHRLLM